MSRSRWTRQEIEILTSLYGTMPAREIAVRLGRTVYQGGPCRNVCLYSIALDARRNGTS